MKPNKLTLSDNKHQKLLQRIKSYKEVLKVTIDKLSLSAFDKHRLIKLFDSYVQLVNHRGPSGTVKYLKGFRNSLYRWRAGLPHVYTRDGVSRAKSGLPNDLVIGKKRLRNEDNLFRGIGTVLQLSYILKGSNHPKIDTVVNNYSGDPIKPIISKFDAFIKEFAPSIKFDEFEPWCEPHSSLKSGPNGQALGTCGVDLSILPDSLINELKILGGDNFTKYIDYGRQFPDMLTQVSYMMNQTFRLKDKKHIFRKLTFVNSPEDKTRVIAIFDYGSQSALKPIHNGFMNQLRKFEADKTYNQGSIVPNFSGDFADSIDLSAATDRFPIGIQKVVVENLLSKEVADAWEKVLVGYDFTVGGQKDREHLVRYSVGQPMGAYSSGAVFSLTHHLIVQYCAKESGANLPFRRYFLLGDDIVIFDKVVASVYRSVIQSLGVEISPLKTITSNKCFEFAKRFFTRTSELTAFPAAALIEQKSIIGIWSTLLVAGERGYNFAQWVLRPGSAAEYAVALLGTKNLLKFKRYSRLAESILILSDPRADQNDYNGAVNSVVNHLGLPFSCNFRGIQREKVLFNLLLYFMNENTTHQIQEVRKFSMGLEDTILNPSSADKLTVRGWDDQPVRVQVTLSPQVQALRRNLESMESMGYEIKELMDRFHGGIPEHAGLDTSSRVLKMLPRAAFQGFSHHNDAQRLLSVLRRTGTPANIDMAGLISRRPDQYRITRFSAFIKNMIVAVEASNMSRQEALS